MQLLLPRNYSSPFHTVPVDYITLHGKNPCCDGVGGLHRFCFYVESGQIGDFQWDFSFTALALIRVMCTSVCACVCVFHLSPPPANCLVSTQLFSHYDIILSPVVATPTLYTQACTHKHTQDRKVQESVGMHTPLLCMHLPFNMLCDNL